MIEMSKVKAGAKTPACFYFFRKLLNAMNIIPQSITVAIISTAKAAPVMCIILPPP